MVTALNQDICKNIKMKKIVILGNSGAGKTTLALQLQQQLNLPLYHLDQLWWLPGWKEDTRENFDRKLGEILRKDSWIIDGEYTRTLAERLKFADTAILLDYPSILCLWRTLKRITLWYGKTRPGMTPGCPEHYDWAFLWYVWRFRRNYMDRINETLQNFHGEVIRLKSPAEAKRFIAHIDRHENQ